jgi:hypothetical protein
VTAAIDWLFRSRTTGRITIAQSPNAALWLFIGASVAGWVFDPTGKPGTTLEVIAFGALVYWAGDEVVRGVNPWRRFLGGTILFWQLERLAMR